MKMEKVRGNYFGWFALIVLIPCIHTAPTLSKVSSKELLLKRHIQSRNELLKMEKTRMLGGRIDLTPKEQKVNRILMSMKENEYQAGMRGEPFPPQMHFFDAKPIIDQSSVFDIIKMMPKGAALHIHDVALSNLTWVISELTYLKGLRYCVSETGLRFSFSEPVTPEEHSSKNCSNWEMVSEARARHGNDIFDEWIFKNLSMVTDNPHLAYPDTYHSWNKFQGSLMAVSDLIYSTEVAFKKYVEKALTEFYDDNVQYLEIRFLALPLILSNGTIANTKYTVQLYKEVAKNFGSYHYDFFGAKFIQQVIRFIDKKSMEQEVLNAIEYRKSFPDSYVGFDLVAQEDIGYTLMHYMEELLKASDDDVGVDVPFFFHAGETGWGGTHVDENLFDAILLNTSRIGHGYGIIKHPLAMEMARNKNIAIEINPISNQVLGLVSDLRNHPAAALFAQDFPLVISSDDPPVWNALPLSHDFYLAFMGFGGLGADLATLKQLALNSLQYSAATKDEKLEMTTKLTKLWDLFLDKVLMKYDEIKD